MFAIDNVREWGTYYGKIWTHQWGATDMCESGGTYYRGQMWRITTFGLRIECILSDGIWNPIHKTNVGRVG
jgi:hypothetical protein